MSNNTALAQLEITKESLAPAVWSTLKNSIFPGAKDESIIMAVSYCAAKDLDVLMKVVHIVGMSVKNAQTGKYEWRDVIMPGIDLYRSKAEKTGVYIGKSAPEWGPMITETLDGVTVTYPEYCRITVKKLVGNVIAEFPAEEFWMENYAKGAKDKDSGKATTAPNEMWKKRPRAQLAKCAEAQALRMAFPNETGGQPTAEEMEGKVMEDVTPQNSASQSLIDKIKPLPTIKPIVVDLHPQPKPEVPALPTLAEQLSILIMEKNVPTTVIEPWLTKANVTTFADMKDEDLQKCIMHIHSRYQER